MLLFPNYLKQALKKKKKKPYSSIHSSIHLHWYTQQIPDECHGTGPRIWGMPCFGEKSGQQGWKTWWSLSLWNSHASLGTGSILGTEKMTGVWKVNLIT